MWLVNYWKARAYCGGIAPYIRSIRTRCTLSPLTSLWLWWALWRSLEQPALKRLFLAYPPYSLYHTILTELPWHSFVLIELKALCSYTQWRHIAECSMAPSFLTIGNRRWQRQSGDLIGFSPCDKPFGIHWIRGWMDPSSSLDTWTSFLLLPGIEPRFLRRQACNVVTAPTELWDLHVWQ